LYRIWFITDTNDSLFPSKSQLFGENTLLDALDLHAELLSSQNKQRDALTAYTLAAQVADLLNNDQLHQASKLILQANDKQRSEKRLDIIYDLYKSEKNEDWLEKALRISERSKSTLVMESIKDKDLLSKHARDSLVIAYQYHGIQLSTLETQLWKLRSTKPIDVNQIEELQTMYSKTMLSQRNLRLLITDKYPTLNIQEPSVSLQILKQKATEKEETLVSYFFGKRSIYQFIIGPSNSSFEKIAPNQKVRDSSSISVYVIINILKKPPILTIHLMLLKRMHKRCIPF